MQERVRVHVASFNTAMVTELCIRSMHRTAGHPFTLVVGDGGSRDGSLAMLERFERAGWLELQVAPAGRMHAEWLDEWYTSCPDRFAVFSDSDVLYRRQGWLREMVARAAETSAALVTPRVQARGGAPYRHPVTGAQRILGERPEPWLMLLDLAQTRPAVTTSFAYQEGEDTPRGRMAYDVSAAFFRDLQAAGLTYAEMAPGFAGAYHHYGSMSWQRSADRRMPVARRAKQAAKYAAARARLGIERVRSRTPVTAPTG